MHYNFREYVCHAHVFDVSVFDNESGETTPSTAAAQHGHGAVHGGPHVPRGPAGGGSTSCFTVASSILAPRTDVLKHILFSATFYYQYVDISPSPPEESPVAYSSVHAWMSNARHSPPACPALTPVSQELSKPAPLPTPARGTSIHLDAQARNLVPILSPCSLSPPSISKYCHLSLKKRSPIWSRLLTTTALQATVLSPRNTTRQVSLLCFRPHLPPRRFLPAQLESRVHGHQIYA